MTFDQFTQDKEWVSEGGPDKKSGWLYPPAHYPIPYSSEHDPEEFGGFIEATNVEGETGFLLVLERDQYFCESKDAKGLRDMEAILYTWLADEGYFTAEGERPKPEHRFK